jgi:hypothetical protein
MDEYVEAFTDFKPTDGKVWTDSEPPLPPDFKVNTQVTKLNFEKMSESFPRIGLKPGLKLKPCVHLSIDEMQASTLSFAICDQILYGRYSLSSFTSTERATFIQYGFARHKPGTNDEVLDEPLAILAALQWINQHAKFSMFECLRRDIERHSKRKNGFEAYLAFHLRKVFETAPRLDTVFAFRSDFAKRDREDLTWQRENFELVTVVAAEDRNNPHVSVVTPSCGSSSNVGFLADSGEEVLEWLSTNKDQFTFCFPPESFGPDLLFFLRAQKSAKLLLVMVQAKKYDKVNKEDLIHGVRTVTPNWLWKCKDKKVRPLC